MRKSIWLYRFGATCAGLAVALFIGEILVRAFNPKMAIKNPEQLKQDYYSERSKIITKNLNGTALSNPKLDTVIYRTINNIGFRGPDLPIHSSSLYKIIACGGSTTICQYLSDGNDWPNLVGNALHKLDSSIWMNNAGMDGQSTFGHIAVLPEKILSQKPQMIIFLVGCNYVLRDRTAD